jgi:hypothetical protein
MIVLTPRSFVRAAVVCVAIIATADEAAAQGSTSDTSANPVYAGCKAFAQNQPASDPQMFNMKGFCAGVLHALAFVSPYLERGPEFRSCVPPESTAAQLAQVVVKFLDEHPERMHEDFRVLALEAFHNAWPCNLNGTKSP